MEWKFFVSCGSVLTPTDYHQVFCGGGGGGFKNKQPNKPTNDDANTDNPADERTNQPRKTTSLAATILCLVCVFQNKTKQKGVGSTTRRSRFLSGLYIILVWREEHHHHDCSTKKKQRQRTIPLQPLHIRHTHHITLHTYIYD
jgi:hypothetical protein